MVQEEGITSKLNRRCSDLATSSFLLFRVVWSDPRSSPDRVQFSQSLTCLSSSASVSSPHGSSQAERHPEDGKSSTNNTNNSLVNMTFPQTSACALIHCPVSWWWNGHVTEKFDVGWQRAVVDVVGMEEARVPSPAAWSVPLSWEVQLGHAVAGGLHAHEERHHSWDGCTQMRMLGESMELKDGVVKGFTLAFFFFFFLSLERNVGSQKWLDKRALPRLPRWLGEERVDGEKKPDWGRPASPLSGWGWIPPRT